MRSRCDAKPRRVRRFHRPKRRIAKRFDPFDRSELKYNDGTEPLEAIHRRWIVLLRALPASEFQRAYNHPEMGAVALDTALALYAWHGKHHTAHVRLVDGTVWGSYADARHASTASGSVAVNVVPSPRVLATFTLPSSCNRSRRTM